MNINDYNYPVVVYMNNKFYVKNGDNCAVFVDQKNLADFLVDEGFHNIINGLNEYSNVHNIHGIKFVRKTSVVKEDNTIEYIECPEHDNIINSAKETINNGNILLTPVLSAQDYNVNNYFSDFEENNDSVVHYFVNTINTVSAKDKIGKIKYYTPNERISVIRNGIPVFFGNREMFTSSLKSHPKEQTIVIYDDNDLFVKLYSKLKSSVIHVKNHKGDNPVFNYYKNAQENIVNDDIIRDFIKNNANLFSLVKNGYKTLVKVSVIESPLVNAEKSSFKDNEYSIFMYTHYDSESKNARYSTVTVRGSNKCIKKLYPLDGVFENNNDAYVVALDDVLKNAPDNCAVYTENYNCVKEIISRIENGHMDDLIKKIIDGKVAIRWLNKDSNKYKTMAYHLAVKGEG